MSKLFFLLFPRMPTIELVILLYKRVGDKRGEGQKHSLPETLARSLGAFTCKGNSELRELHEGPTCTFLGFGKRNPLASSLEAASPFTSLQFASLTLDPSRAAARKSPFGVR